MFHSHIQVSFLPSGMTRGTTQASTRVSPSRCRHDIALPTTLFPTARLLLLQVGKRLLALAPVNGRGPNVIKLLHRHTTHATHWRSHTQCCACVSSGCETCPPACCSELHQRRHTHTQHAKQCALRKQQDGQVLRSQQWLLLRWDGDSGRHSEHPRPRL